MVVFLVISAFDVKLGEKLRKKNMAVRWLNYAVVIIIIFASFILQNGGYGDSINFIYMQF